MDRNQIDPTLDELRSLYGMSVRAYNVCKNNGLRSLATIQAYRIEKGGFKTLKSIGVTTEYELNELVDQALEAGYGLSAEDPKSPLVDPGLLEAWFDTHYFELSRLAQKALLGLIGELTAAHAVAFYAQQDVISKLEGPPTRIKELAVFGEQLMQRAGASVAYIHLPVQLLISEVSAAHHWMRLLRIPAHYAPHLVDGSGRLTLFRFLERFYSSPIQTKANKQAVFLVYAQGSSPLPLHDDLALKLDLTRERVRQMVEAQERELPRELPRLLNVPGWEERYTQLILQSPVHVVDGSLMRGINDEENTNWGPYFEGHVLRVLNNQTHVQVDWNKVGVPGRAGRRMDLEKPLLVERNMLEEFLRCVRAMEERIDAPRTEELVQDLDSFVRSATASVAENMQAALRSFISVRYREFMNADAQIHLARNSQPDKLEHLQAVLEALNEPSTVEHIVVAWNERFPGIPSNAHLIRGLVHNHPDRFFSIGRSSTYGLRSWEQVKPGVRGGTIRRIVRELLEKAGGPVAVEVIMQEVLRYRRTNRQSVVTNLAICGPGQFIFLDGDRIALAVTMKKPVLSPAMNTERLPLRRKDIKRFTGQPLAALKAFLIDKLNYTDTEATQALASRLRKGRLAVDQNGLIIPSSSTEDPEDQSPDQFTVPEE